jgi:hypothetical protein
MKLQYFILIILLFSFGKLSGQTTLSAKVEKEIIQEIRQNMEEQLKVLNSGGSPEAILPFFWQSDSLIFCVPQGVLVGYDDLKSFQTSMASERKERNAKYSYRLIRLEPMSETGAFAVGQINVTASDPSKSFSYHFSCIFEKKGAPKLPKKDRWKAWLITSETISIDRKSK